ncbi:MAG: ABC transporter substrate-binding protein [Chloroflexota bacterium]
MSKKILWLVVTWLMALSLVIAACGPAAQPTAPTAPTTPTTPTTPATPTTPTAPAEEKPQKETVAPAADVPKYGGTITYRLASDPTNFDSGTQRSGGALINTVYQQFVGSDWLRGPAGSDVTNYAAGGGSLEDSLGPQVAEGWQMPQQGVWILKIRQGVRWQPVKSEAGRLMAGRQVTADDIVSSFNRLFKAPENWIKYGQPQVWSSATIEKTGPWEVTVKTPVDYVTSFVWLIQGAGFERVYPPEVGAKYGDLANWRNAVGTGPYMLVDYVPGSQFLFEKNPAYWEKDPVGPGKGNQLPYPDTLRELIIPDLSTTYAALRTGKLDLQSDVPLIDAQSLFKTTPRIESLKYLSSAPWGIAMKQDDPKKPFSNVKVRQALMLATNFEAIKRDYYAGEAEIEVWPVNKQMSSLYTPLSQMPDSVQALYKYNPEKAKQLLKDAGYPGGFKTSVVINSASERIDELSIFKDMWAKVGIDLTLDVRDTGVYNRIAGVVREWDDMLYRSVSGSFIFQMYHAPYRNPAILNPSRINNPPGADPYLEEIYNEMQKYIFIDMPKVYQAFKKVPPYVMEQAFVIPRPTPYSYNFWWPWLKNYYGQGAGLIRYGWVDQELKKSMGY